MLKMGAPDDNIQDQINRVLSIQNTFGDNVYLCTDANQGNLAALEVLLTKGA